MIMGLLHIKPSFNGSPNCLRSAYIVIRSCYLNWGGGACRCADKQLFVSGQRGFFKGHRGAFSKVTLKILKHGIILACGPTCGQLLVHR